MRRMLGWLFAIGTCGFLLAACGWIYMTSNVPTPGYVVTQSEGEIELREYPELVVAEVTTRGARGEAVRAGFSPLAGYIFAKERPGEKIAMTAPVTQRAESEDEWAIQFIMPDGYTLDNLPAPAGTTVRLEKEPAARRAAIQFSGSWTDEVFAQKEAELRAWLDAKGIKTRGAPILAYYNDPFTPGFMRRNEVLLDLAP